MYQLGPAFVQEDEIAPPQAFGPPRRLPASTLTWAHLPGQSLTGQSTRSKEIIAFHWGKSDLQFRCHLFFKQLGCCARSSSSFGEEGLFLLVWFILGTSLPESRGRTPQRTIPDGTEVQRG